MTQTKRFRTREGREVTLELFKFDTCPYCQRVFSVLDRLGLEIPMADIRRDPAALERLIAVGGKRQVPCLFIDGEPMYESADIAAWLEDNFGQR
ncbi:MAG: glutathione S-transferase domain-containing protein [Planctomycetota bacterium]|nr:MAG: glutathione S-transferase domain-containing protein [Planctomycetota bacterium]